jgi:hypothetical protein
MGEGGVGGGAEEEAEQNEMARDFFSGGFRVCLLSTRAGKDEGSWPRPYYFIHHRKGGQYGKGVRGKEMEEEL